MADPSGPAATGTSGEERLSLEEVYAEAMMEEFIDLEEFCERVAQGRYGSYSAQEIREFLRATEAQMITNMETKLEEAPHLAPMREEAEERVHEQINRLIERYAREG